MMVKLMTKRIIANYYEGKAPVPMEARHDLRFIWNDEFQTLFDVGIVKVAEKWDKNDRQKYTIPKPKNNKFSSKQQKLDFLFSIN